MDKRKLAAALALGGSIAIVSLFGGSDEPVSGSYRGGYYASSGSYRTGAPERGHWNGKDFVVVINADDSWSGNLLWPATAGSLGITYSMNTSETDTGVAGHLTTLEIIAFEATGNKVESTGRSHDGGIKKWSIASYPDSMRWEVGPSWVETWIEQDVGVVGSCYIADLGFWNYEAATTAADSGYAGARLGPLEGSRGYTTTYNGDPRWDYGRYLDWDKPTALFGFLSFYGNQTDEGIFYPAGATTEPDSIRNRADRNLFAVSAANGYAPIVVFVHAYNEMDVAELRTFVEYCQSRGDVWITTTEEMIDHYRANHVPVDPPDWAFYAKLEGIAAIDSVFWGPEVTPVSCSTDSFLFHNSTTMVDSSLYTAEYNDGMTEGALMVDTPSVAQDMTGNVDINYYALPVLTQSGFVVLTFNVDELDGKEIVSARIGYNSAFDTTEFDSERTTFTFVAGVTDTSMMKAFAESDMSYTYQDVSTTTLWDRAISDFDWPTDFGDFVYAKTVSATGENVEIVTDYINQVVEDDLDAAMFVLGGHRLAGSVFWRLRGHGNSNAALRPYLIVETCQ